MRAATRQGRGRHGTWGLQGGGRPSGYFLGLPSEKAWSSCHLLKRESKTSHELQTQITKCPLNITFFGVQRYIKIRLFQTYSFTTTTFCTYIKVAPFPIPHLVSQTLNSRRHPKSLYLPQLPHSGNSMSYVNLKSFQLCIICSTATLSSHCTWL